jgi:hypothetical protein
VAFVGAMDTITISKIRVNANALGASSTVTSTASAAVPAAFTATNPITFIGTTTVPVATVQAKATTVTFGPVPATPASILTCVGTGGTGFSLTVTENFASALTSLADETGFSNVPVPTSGTLIVITIKTVPVGLTVTPGAPVSTPASLTFAGTPAAQTGSAANGGVLTFTYTITATNTLAVESVFFPFVAALPASTPLGGITATGTVSLGPTAAGTIQFAPNTQGTGNAIVISDCVTNLLFPFVTAFNDPTSKSAGAHFDTGIAIANTTADPFGPAITALPQAGNCSLTLFKSTTGAAVGPFNTASAASGGTITLLLSSFTGGQASPPFAGQTGYIIAICNFQNAHGFAFIANNFGIGDATISQGYVALVIPNTIPRNPAGFGAGEQLNN